MNEDRAMQRPDEPLRQALSAFADGEPAGRDPAELTTAWARQPELRRDWQSWHLIGDTLRSDELAGRGSQAAFLATLRERMAKEPVVLAPTAPITEPRIDVSLRRNRSPWGGRVAVAAGFVAVAAVLVLLNAPPTGTPGVVSAQAPGRTATVVPVAAIPSPAVVVASRPLGELGPMLRDARLDAYLTAHRQVGINSLMGVAGAAVQPVLADGARR
jgi:sigma-E factor negative regulatory protein RseA